MKALKIQLAGLVVITGMSMAAVTGCSKEKVEPASVRYYSQDMDSPGDTTGTGFSGNDDGPKFPPHFLKATDSGDTTAVGGSGNDDGPKFPPH